MMSDPIVLLDNLVLSLSDALDLVAPCSVDHQHRVAYCALRIGQRIGCSLPEQSSLMHAAALHDLGLLSLEEKILSMGSDVDEVGEHARIGADLLRRLDVFEEAATLVEYHHAAWGSEAAWGDLDPRTRLLANAIHLGDTVDRMIRRDVPIFAQARGIADAVAEKADAEFAPELVDAFRDLIGGEYFWLDLTSYRIYAVLRQMAMWPVMQLSLDTLERIAQVFGRVVDYRSAYTAAHSAGVAATAGELGRRLYFGERENKMLRIAGHLHDLGKVRVPNSILEKPGKLTPEEYQVVRAHTYDTFQILSTIGGFDEIAMWAAYHHERMNGTGYPFRLSGDVLPLGSRIMAVADVFTAMAEERSFRAGADRAETHAVLGGMVRNGSLDGQIVDILVGGYDEIDHVRAATQREYGQEYRRRFLERIPRT